MKILLVLLTLFSFSSFGKLSGWDQYPSSQIQYLTDNKQFRTKFLELEKINKKKWSTKDKNIKAQLEKKAKQYRSNLNKIVTSKRLNIGKYKSIKNNLDLSYHGIYTRVRQKFHDKVIGD